MKNIMKGIEYIACALLLLLSALILNQVILRNILGWGFVWSEEMARFLLLSMVLLMTPVMFFKGAHVRLDYFQKFIPTRLKGLHSMLLTLLTTLFFCVYTFSHLQLIDKMGDVRSPSLNMANTWFFAAGIVGSVTGIAVGLARIVTIFIHGARS